MKDIRNPSNLKMAGKPLKLGEEQVLQKLLVVGLVWEDHPASKK